MHAVASPFGWLSITGVDRLESVRITAEPPGQRTATPLEQSVAEQLEDYLAGTRSHFDLPLDTSGSPLQRDVWSLLDALPWGHTVTYGQIAKQLGLPPGAARAVGAAVGANPVLIVRPCHRVLGANGALTGYAGGLDAKLWLLQHEGVLL